MGALVSFQDPYIPMLNKNTKRQVISLMMSPCKNLNLEEQNVRQRVHLPEILWIAFSPWNLDFCRAVLLDKKAVFYYFFPPLQTHLKVFENSGDSASYRLKFRGILQQAVLCKKNGGGGEERTGWKIDQNNISCFLLPISAWTEKEFTRYFCLQGRLVYSKMLDWICKLVFKDIWRIWSSINFLKNFFLFLGHWDHIVFQNLLHP